MNDSQNDNPSSNNEISLIEKASTYLKKEMNELGLSYREELFDAIVAYLGDSILDKDASLVACSDPKEIEEIKSNFLMGKLSMENDKQMDKVIQEVCHALGESNRQKHRVTFYYLLVVILKKASVFVPH